MVQYYIYKLYENIDILLRCPICEETEFNTFKRIDLKCTTYNSSDSFLPITENLINYILDCPTCGHRLIFNKKIEEK